MRVGIITFERNEEMSVRSIKWRNFALLTRLIGAATAQEASFCHRLSDSDKRAQEEYLLAAAASIIPSGSRRPGNVQRYKSTEKPLFTGYGSSEYMGTAVQVKVAFSSSQH